LIKNLWKRVYSRLLSLSLSLSLSSAKAKILHIILRNHNPRKIEWQSLDTRYTDTKMIAQKGRNRKRERERDGTRDAHAERERERNILIVAELERRFSPPRRRSTRGGAVRPAVSWLELPDSQLIRRTPPWWRNRRRIAALASLLFPPFSTPFFAFDGLAFSSFLSVPRTRLIAPLKCDWRARGDLARLWKGKDTKYNKKCVWNESVFYRSLDKSTSVILFRSNVSSGQG